MAMLLGQQKVWKVACIMQVQATLCASYDNYDNYDYDGGSMGRAFFRVLSRCSALSLISQMSQRLLGSNRLTRNTAIANPSRCIMAAYNAVRSQHAHLR